MRYKKEKLVAFDVETHLIQPGLVAPPLVCGSIAGDGVEGELLTADRARQEFRGIIADKDVIICGANIAYDNIVMLVDAGCPLDLMQAVFQKYIDGLVFDVQLAEALHAIRGGHLGLTKERGTLYDPTTGKVSKRYSLAVVVHLTLGRGDAKKNDVWRLSYALLEDTPHEDWPPEARQYPIDDAVNTYEAAVCQKRTRANIHNLREQVYTAFAMSLGAARGFVVDAAELDAVKERVQKKQDEGREEFVDLGFYKDDGKVDTKKIKRLIAEAYGATQLCTVCSGTQRTLSIKTGNEINCKDCGTSGYDLEGTSVPRTATGGVGAGRDSLIESGNEDLMNFADYTKDDKVLTTYAPWLEKGRHGPINLRPNALLANGRASYGDVVQQLPTDMGVRECIVAREGHYLFSCDYSALELATHAQSLLWLLPNEEIHLAKAINAGVKVHDLLGSQMMGLSYEDFLARRLAGDKYCIDIRSAAKAANFGFPGGMGVVTFVLAKRKENFYTGKFKGIRLCMLMGGQEECGTTMLTEWKGRHYPPVCKDCVECSEDLKKQWFKAWPENRAYFALIGEQVKKQGYIIQHVSERVRGGVGFCDAANGYFSALAAEGAKDALCSVAYEEYCVPSSPLYGSRTILFAHDELLGETPIEGSHEACVRLSEVMVSSMRKYTPDVLIEADPCLMKRLYKNAEAVFDENGKLIPWEPEQ